VFTLLYIFYFKDYGYFKSQVCFIVKWKRQLIFVKGLQKLMQPDPNSSSSTQVRDSPFIPHMLWRLFVFLLLFSLSRLFSTFCFSFAAQHIALFMYTQAWGGVSRIFVNNSYQQLVENIHTYFYVISVFFS